MNDQERIERRVRIAKTMGWVYDTPPTAGRWWQTPKGKTAYDCPDPDNDPAALLTAMEWALRQGHHFSCIEYDQSVFAAYGPERFEGGHEWFAEGDTLTEAIVSAVDAAIQAQEKG